jgi:mannose-1-phosphate guanylyltransferase
MIQATVDRLGDLVPAQRTLIVTNRRLVEPIAAQLPDLPPQAVLGEPCKRDTAPCIGLAALLVRRDDPDATMAVMPADHVISQHEEFRGAVRQAAELVEQNPQRIVTFGIRPTYPAEIFGYIERAEPVGDAKGDAPAFRVKQFREKPKAELARQYLDSGNFYWNSGIFVWKAATILDELAKRQPAMTAHLRSIAGAFETAEFPDIFEREFTAIKGVSIDYAVMEHATDVVVIEAPFDWDDLGSWRSLPRLLGKDEEGNTVDGKHLGLNTTGCIIRGEADHLIGTLGLNDIIIVQTPNATLVANKQDEEAVRQLVKMIEQHGWDEYL